MSNAGGNGVLLEFTRSLPYSQQGSMHIPLSILFGLKKDNSHTGPKWSGSIIAKKCRLESVVIIDKYRSVASVRYSQPSWGIRTVQIISNGIHQIISTVHSFIAIPFRRAKNILAIMLNTVG
jgi:hypothetical protein